MTNYDDVLQDLLDFYGDVSVDDKIFLREIIFNNRTYIINNHTKITSEITKNISLVLSAGFSDIQIIKFIIEKFELKDPLDSYSLYEACRNNHDLSVIKFLVEELKMNTNEPKFGAGNCLTYACSNNTNLDVIKYLTQELKLDANQFNDAHCDSFLNACLNKNPKIIKYLIKNYKMNIYVKDEDGYDLIDSTVFNFHEDSAILKYLIEETTIPIQLRKFGSQRYEEIILKITKNFKRLNELLTLGSNSCFGKNFMIEIIKKINPLLLEPSWLNYAEIKSPYEYNFDQFIKYVDKLECVVPIVLNTHQCMRINKKYTFNRPSDILFKSKDTTYYGDRQIVYSSMKLFEDMISHIDFKEPIELDPGIPEYVINMFIQSCYTQQINIDDIGPEDFMKFIIFIDGYPTDYVSIEHLEDDLIEYMKNNVIGMNDRLKDIIKKYKLKKMYLYCHNNLFNERNDTNKKSGDN